MSDFMFLLVTDTHVDARQDVQDITWWHNMLYSRSIEILSTFVKDANEIRPDFVVHCGDLTNASDEKSFHTAFEILSGLKCPLYLVPGNHDTYEPGSRRLAAKLLGLNKASFFQSIEVDGWRMILIDGVYWVNKDGLVHEIYNPVESVDLITLDSELDAIRAELDRDSQTPTICFTHPVLKVRDAYAVPTDVDGVPLEHPKDMRDRLANSGRITTIIDRYLCVKAGFCGHGHWNEVYFENCDNAAGRKLYCQTSSLVEFPCEYRKVRVTNSRINVETLGLSEEKFANLSYLSSHGNRWTAGRPIDRSATNTC